MKNSRHTTSSTLPWLGSGLAAALLATGCPAPPADQLAALTLPPPQVAADGTITVTEADRDAHLYAFYLAAPGSTERAAEREALILDVLRQAQRSVAEEDALDVHHTLYRALRLFDPDELDARPDSAALRKLLAWLEPVARRLGRPEDSLTIAEARVLSDPTDAEAAHAVEEIVAWIGAGEDETEALEHQVQVGDVVTEVLPAPGLVKQLIGLIFRRHDLGLQPVAIETLEDWMINAQREQYFFSGLTLNVLRLAIRMGRPETTADLLAPYRGTSAYLPDVLDEVAGLADPLDRADAAAGLAQAVSSQFVEEGRQLCTALRREFPADGRFSACLGQYYYRQGEYGVAARLLLEAASRDPDKREFAEQAMVLLAQEIQEGMDGSSWDALQRLHEAFRSLFDRYRAKWPQSEPPVDETAVLRLMANAALIGGDVGTARSLQQQALELQPTAQSYFEFGQMEARAGDPQRALELFRAGLAVTTGDLADRTLAQASIREEMGLLQQQQGDADGADATFDAAVDDWKHLARAGVISEAEVDGKVGILLVRRGKREEGLRRISAAVHEAGEDDYGPEQDQLVYNETLSFLHTEGERDLLTELFPLVATRQDLDATWRVYYALWTLGALRRAGLPDDDETVAFLRAIRASGWSGVLARFYGGELDYDGAMQEARTFGQQTELRYYESLNRFAAGDAAGARELLRQVVDTHIFNYFEWQMAATALADLDAAAAQPDASR
jgi:tetratricopeptide (TPR) repeat protein